jgi:hypothetical protein
MTLARPKKPSFFSNITTKVKKVFNIKW